MGDISPPKHRAIHHANARRSAQVRQNSRTGNFEVSHCSSALLLQSKFRARIDSINWNIPTPNHEPQITLHTARNNFPQTALVKLLPEESKRNRSYSARPILSHFIIATKNIDRYPPRDAHTAKLCRAPPVRRGRAKRTNTTPVGAPARPTRAPNIPGTYGMLWDGMPAVRTPARSSLSADAHREAATLFEFCGNAPARAAPLPRCFVFTSCRVRRAVIRR